MTINNYKDNKLSTKVQKILFYKGFSHIFNWEDYRFYKRKFKNAIFPEWEIAECFISETSEPSNFADYEF